MQIDDAEVVVLHSAETVPFGQELELAVEETDMDSGEHAVAVVFAHHVIWK